VPAHTGVHRWPHSLDRREARPCAHGSHARHTRHGSPTRDFVGQRGAIPAATRQSCAFSTSRRTTVAPPRWRRSCTSTSPAATLVPSGTADTVGDTHRGVRCRCRLSSRRRRRHFTSRPRSGCDHRPPLAVAGCGRAETRHRVKSKVLVTRKCRPNTSEESPAVLQRHGRRRALAAPTIASRPLNGGCAGRGLHLSAHGRGLRSERPSGHVRAANNPSPISRGSRHKPCASSDAAIRAPSGDRRRGHSDDRVVGRRRMGADCLRRIVCRTQASAPHQAAV
jgi:hypothetical protein